MKYAPQIARAFSERTAEQLATEANDRVSSCLGYLGQVKHGKTAGGEAYGVPIDVHHWLIGPIAHMDTP